MIQIHKININAMEADSKISGDRLFSVVINDECFQKGDLVQYTNQTHKISNRIYEITFVYTGPGIKEGYAILGEQDVTNDIINKKGKYANLQVINNCQEDQTETKSN